MSIASRRSRLWVLLSALVGLGVVLFVWLGGDPPPERVGDDAATQRRSPTPASSESPADSERAAADEGNRIAADCRIRCVDTTSVSIAACTVFAWTAGQSDVRITEADESGLATFAAIEGTGGVLAIARDGLWGIKTPIEWKGEHTVVLGGDGVVEGRLVVDGAPAPEGLELALRIAAPPLPTDVPAELGAQLEAREASTRQRVARTGFDGTFAFRGLPVGGRATLLPPAVHWLTPEAADWYAPSATLQRHVMTGRVMTLGVAIPSTRLVLTTTRLPVVTGRVVWDDDGTPVANAQVLVNAEFENSIRATNQCVTRVDGTFVAGLEPAQVSRVDLWADAGRRPSMLRARAECGHGVAGAAGSSEGTLAVPDLARPIELRLRRAPKTWFVVTDSSSQPVAGARVDVDACSPTDREGLGWFQAAKCTLVGAPDHCVVPALASAGDGSREHPLRFELPRANRVRIVIAGDGARGLRGLRLVLETAGPPMAGRRTWALLDTQLGGPKASRGWINGPHGSFDFRLEVEPGPGGGATLCSLEPGLACDVRVRDPLDSVLAHASFVAPPFGQETVVELRVTEATRCMRGRVLREDGTPIGKQVSVVLARERWTWHATAYTQKSGHFEFPALHGEGPFELVVTEPGFVKATRSGLMLTSDLDIGEIRLAAGREVTVRVVDETGAAVDLYAEPSEFREQQGQKLGPGLWRFPNLPSIVEFRAEVQGREFRALADARANEVTLKVPQLARVWFPMEQPSRDGGPLQREVLVELRSLDAGERRLVRIPPQAKAEDAICVLPGSYAAQRVRREVGADGVEQFEPFGLAATMSLRAGELTAIAFP